MKGERGRWYRESWYVCLLHSFCLPNCLSPLHDSIFSVPVRKVIREMKSSKQPISNKEEERKMFILQLLQQRDNLSVRNKFKHKCYDDNLNWWKLLDWYKVDERVLCVCFTSLIIKWQDAGKQRDRKDTANWNDLKVKREEKIPVVISFSFSSLCQLRDRKNR